MALIIAIWVLNHVDEQTARVTRVIDGDTLVLQDGQRVRLLQINAPEEGECGYEQAASELTRLVLNKTVKLESDSVFGNRDKYERLLRYVHIGDTNVNVELQQNNFVNTMFYEGKQGKYAYLFTGTGSCA